MDILNVDLPRHMLDQHVQAFWLCNTVAWKYTYAPKKAEVIAAKRK